MIKIKFVKEDCWIGLYWKKTFSTWNQNIPSELARPITTKFYLCIIPCFPIIWSTHQKI